MYFNYKYIQQSRTEQYALTNWIYWPCFDCYT